jgi:tripartite-type tricarboxylate transporter receptor subunit TctC
MWLTCIRRASNIRKLALASVLVAAAIVVNVRPASAGWPDHPVRLVLPYGPGGVADVPARILADKLSANLGARFVVENMPGPGGINAARAVLTAAPDGYTLGFVSNGNAIAPVMFAHLPYDPVSQFQMISQVGEFTLAFAANASSKFKTVEDVIKYARANPGKLNVGTVSVGSTQNFGAELLKSMAKIDFQIIPYKTSPEVSLALLRGEIDLMIDFPVAIDGEVQDGTLRYLATTSLQRSPFLPNVPSVNESGLSNYEVSSWNGVFAPKGTPPKIVDAINRAIRDALASPDVVTKFKKVGIVAQASSPEQLVERLKSDIKKWEAVRARAGIQKH